MPVEQKGLLKFAKDVLKNKTMWRRLMWLIGLAMLTAVALAPKDIPTPWGVYHQGPLWKTTK